MSLQIWRKRHHYSASICGIILPSKVSNNKEHWPLPDSLSCAVVFFPENCRTLMSVDTQRWSWRLWSWTVEDEETAPVWASVNATKGQLLATHVKVKKQKQLNSVNPSEFIGKAAIQQMRWRANSIKASRVDWISVSLLRCRDSNLIAGSHRSLLPAESQGVGGKGDSGGLIGRVGEQGQRKIIWWAN